jgi:hypothetical protein
MFNKKQAIKAYVSAYHSKHKLKYVYVLAENAYGQWGIYKELSYNH